MSIHLNELKHLLTEYESRSESDAAIHEVLEFVTHQGAFSDRNCYDDGHITASAWITNRDRNQCLFTHHKKLNKWLQLGGHVDNDAHILDVALREAKEESGLSVSALETYLFDLDIHEIPARKQEPAHRHYDFRFLLTASSLEAYRRSSESHGLKWFTLNEVFSAISEESILRMLRKHCDYFRMELE